MKSLVYFFFLLTLVYATGCQTTASRMAWMNPARMWNRGAETKLAEAPPLPSEQFAADEGAKQPANPPQPAVASIASSSAFPPTVPGYTPAAEPPAPAKPGMTPQMGPYNAVASTPSSPSESIAATGNSLASEALDISKPVDLPTGNDLYGNYKQQMNQATEQVAQDLNNTANAALSGITVPPMPEMPEIEGFSLYTESTPSTPASDTTTPSDDSVPPPATRSPTEGLATNAEVPTATGGYSPGGTSRYPSDPVNIATRPGAEGTSTTPGSSYH